MDLAQFLDVFRLTLLLPWLITVVIVVLWVPPIRGKRAKLGIAVLWVTGVAFGINLLYIDTVARWIAMLVLGLGGVAFGKFLDFILEKPKLSS